MSTAEKVREWLRDADLTTARRRDCARAVGMSMTMFGKVLMDERTTYGRLLDAERRRRTELIIASRPKIYAGLVAKAAGYLEDNSASRAFPRWFGVTIREFKRRGQA